MTEHLVWGYPIMIHFFLVGVGGGAMSISAFFLLRNGRLGRNFSIVRYGAFLAPIAVVDDGFVLIAELGHPGRFLNVMRTVNFHSPMWVGSFVIGLFIAVSLVYAFTFLDKNAAPGDRWDTLRRAMAWIGIPLGIALTLYPGIMLGIMRSRPFWNSGLLPVVYLMSGMAVALAAIVLARILFRKGTDPDGVKEYRENNYLLVTSNIVALGGELLFLLLFVIFAHVTGGRFAHAMETVNFPGGVLALQFWLGVVGVGILVPIVAGLAMIVPKLGFGKEYTVSRKVESIVPVTVIIGSFMLSYVVMIGGQITGPIGL